MRDGGSVGSSTGAHDGSTGVFDELMHLAEHALNIPAPAKSRWHRAGVSPRTERVLELLSFVLVSILMIGWTWTIVGAATVSANDPDRGATRAMVARSIANLDAPNAAYLTDASLAALSGELRGASGKLRARVVPAGSPLETDALPEGAELRAQERSSDQSTSAPSAGIWRLAIAVGSAIKPITDFNLISLRPSTEKRNGRVGLYYIGNWPGEKGRVSTPSAHPPIATGHRQGSSR